MASGGRRDRPELERALALVEAGEADVVMAAKLDRLSRSVVDFGSTVERVRAAGGAVVVLDPAIDLSTENGELVANVLMAVAQWERLFIRRRIGEAFDEQRAASGRTGHLRVDPRVVARIRRFRTAGRGWSSIADQLTREGVPTARGLRGGARARSGARR